MTSDVTATAEVHEHAGSDYYLEQLLSVAVCGAFSATAVAMYARGMLKHMLAPEFHVWVLGGGIALAAITLLRVVALWRASRPEDHSGHNHAPGEACNHDTHVHGPGCGHDHSDGHEHGSVFWRVVVMLFPVALFVMGLPNEGFSPERVAKMLGNDTALDAAEVAAKEGGVQQYGFSDMANAALDAETRESMTGRTVRVRGQMKRIGDKALTLFYLKMTCCAADQVPLKAQITTKESLVNLPLKDLEWVEVVGVLQFAPLPGTQNQYIPIIRSSVPQITKTAPAL
jgi:hypothetical protein